MGDVVITLPYLQHLRNSLPGSVRLDLLTREETEDIPKNIILFDNVFSLGGGRHHRKQVLLIFFLLPKLLLQRYDMIIDLQNNRISEIVRKVLRPAAWCVFDRFSPVAAGERTRLTMSVPALRARSLENFLTTTSVFRAVFSERTGRGADDFELRVLAGAVVGALVAALELWVETDQGEGLDEIVDRTLALLEPLG